MNQKEIYLHNIAARFILDESLDLEITGKPAEIDALHNLLIVSKSLKEALDNNKNIETISKLLEEKKVLTKKFEEISNITWRL
jgi:hypothetical protein